MPEETTAVAETTSAPSVTGESLLTNDLPPATPPAEEKAPETQEGEGQTSTEDAKPTGAPEVYEFKAPEGMTLDEKAVETFSPMLKELNLSQEAAQKLMDSYASFQAAKAQEMMAAITIQREAWVSEAKADKEIGGQAFDSNLKAGKAFVGKFGSPELIKVLNDTGLGDHPAVIKAFVKAGLAMSEDKHVSGSEAPPKERSLVDRLYGSKPQA